MSLLTDAVIICMCSDDESIGKVNGYLLKEDDARQQQFVKQDNSATGGTKASTLTVYQACFNHVYPSVILDAFNQADWKNCYKTAVLLMDDEFDTHPVYYFCKGHKYHRADMTLPDCHSM